MMIVPLSSLSASECASLGSNIVAARQSKSQRDTGQRGRRFRWRYPRNRNRRRTVRVSAAA